MIPRILGDSSNASNYYHCCTRVIEGRHILVERAARALMRRLIFAEARFTGVRVLTYCIMDNHLHVLLEVPHRDPKELAAMSDGAFLRRLGCIYSAETMTEIRADLRTARKGGERAHRCFRERFEARMLDLSVYMKEVKQRFSQWYNRRHQRKGPLWEARFRSVLVEGEDRRWKGRGSGRQPSMPDALLVVAAYIDLNPVRAGMVDDPKDFRWCGYSEAVAGVAEMRAGIARCLGESTRAADLRGSVSTASRSARATDLNAASAMWWLFTPCSMSTWSVMPPWVDSA